MAHYQRNAVIASLDARDDALRLGYRQAEPVHAGIDMDGGAARPAGAAAEHVPFGKFIEIADHGLAVDLRVGVAGVLEEAVEHIDRSRRHRSADHTGFIEGRDEKRLAAGCRKRAGDLRGAAAIGIRLDHPGAFGRNGCLLELAPVATMASRSTVSTPVALASAAAWFASGVSGVLCGMDLGSGAMFMPHFTRQAAAVQPRSRVNSRDPASCRPAQGR